MEGMKWRRKLSIGLKQEGREKAKMASNYRPTSLMNTGSKTLISY